MPWFEVVSPKRGKVSSTSCNGPIGEISIHVRSTQVGERTFLRDYRVHLPLSDTPISKDNPSELPLSTASTPPLVNIPENVPRPSTIDISKTSVPPSGPGSSTLELFVTKKRAEDPEEQDATVIVKFCAVGRENVGGFGRDWEESARTAFKESCTEAA